MEQPLPQLIHFGREICNDLDQAERREWWLANGLGGYAGGNLAGTLTRRYHGLLMAALQPPLGRTLVFAKADASLLVNGQNHPLHTNRWADGSIEPRGYLHLESFHLDGRLPVWRYALGELRLEARVWLEMGANTTYLAWRLLSPHGEESLPRLSVRLLVNARDHHGQSPAGAFDAKVEASERELRVSLPHAQPLRFRSRCGRFRAEQSWIERFDLPGERARGLPEQDNHLCIGEVDLPLYPGEWVGFAASLEPDPSPYFGEALRRRQQQDASLLRMAKVQNACLATAPAWIDQLVLAACSFLVERPLPEGRRGMTVMAGYPWFSDWGRDSFVALAGLTLPTHRHEEARQILQSWLPHLSDGLLPNHFPESGEPPEYNSADAALWYVEAWRAYIEASHDLAALQHAYPSLCSLLDWHLRGTRYGIGVDPADGLLRAGEGSTQLNSTQLTWMDARVDGQAVTARIGKPVEINALWFNALLSLAGFADLLKQDADPFLARAEQVRQAFQRYLRSDGQGLHDLLDGPQGDDAHVGWQVRPNQILAVSLAHSPLDRAAQSAVVKTVGERLLTSYGLRTLDPCDPAYRPRYDGGVASRDAAYHQGPAWAWLLPHYALAVHRAGADAADAQALLEPLADHLADAGLGSISELFDAEPPHTPRGAPSQAWSVACVLDAWCRLEKAKRHD